MDGYHKSTMMGRRWMIGRNKSGEAIPPHSAVSLVKDLSVSGSGLNIVDTGEWELDIYKPREMDEVMQDPALLAISGPVTIPSSGKGLITQDWPTSAALDKPPITNPSVTYSLFPGRRLGVKRGSWGLVDWPSGAFSLIARELTNNGYSPNPILSGTKFTTGIVNTIRDVRCAAMAVTGYAGVEYRHNGDSVPIAAVNETPLLTPVPDGVIVHIPSPRKECILFLQSGTFSFQFNATIEMGGVDLATVVVFTAMIARSSNAQSVANINNEVTLPYSAELTIPQPAVEENYDLAVKHKFALSVCGLVNAQPGDVLRIRLSANKVVNVVLASGMIAQQGAYLGFDGQLAEDIF